MLEAIKTIAIAIAIISVMVIILMAHVFFANYKVMKPVLNNMFETRDPSGFSYEIPESSYIVNSDESGIDLMIGNP